MLNDANAILFEHDRDGATAECQITAFLNTDNLTVLVSYSFRKLSFILNTTYSILMMIYFYW